MDSIKKHKFFIPCILGPTAIGKTDLCVRLAEDLGCQIISCDSRQIYRLFTIGTSKPDTETQQRVKHWLIDILDPHESYSAYRFMHDATALIKNNPSQRFLLCGGTGFYCNALQFGLGLHIASDPIFQKECMQRLETEGSECLYHQLQSLDPLAAQKINARDIVRTIRALQVLKQTGKSITHFKPHNENPDITFLPILLTMDRNELYVRINTRVISMMKQGLWEEFCSLRSLGYTEQDPAMQSVGYKELFAMEQGNKTTQAVIEEIQQNTRHYAKRQICWFAHKTKGLYVNIKEDVAYDRIKQEVVNFFAQKQ